MRSRADLLAVVAGLLALLIVVIAVPVNVVTGYLPAAVTRDRLPWIGATCGLVLLIAVLTWWSSKTQSREATPGKAKTRELTVPLRHLPPMVSWIERPELAQVVSALTSQGSSFVAVTTGLVGAGGFGKTTLAARACQDSAVVRRFPGGICWVTVGRDLEGPDLAARIDQVIADLGVVRLGSATLEGAGQGLAAALAAGRGRILLVADDVWSVSQLEPFLAASRISGLLITTRRPAVLAQTGARRIVVDTVTAHVAAKILGQDLPPVPASLERQLVEVTGGWPLLLGLLSQRMADDVRRGASLEVAATDAAARLIREGPTALDIADDKSRRTAVSVTIDYSLDVFEPSDRERFYELSVFAEDAEIPLAVIAQLWQETAGLSAAGARVLCERLDGMSLLSIAWTRDIEVISIHDVIRAVAASRLGDRTPAVHEALIHSARLLTGSTEDGDGTSWWRLPDTIVGAYMQENLIYHLTCAGLDAELDQVTCDLRFLDMRLRRSGLSAVISDLARSSAPAVVQLRGVIEQNAHLITPTAHLLVPTQEDDAPAITTLTSRLGDIPEVASLLPAVSSGLRAWTARSTWPLPDQPSDQLIRTLIAEGLRISRDGAWLATVGEDGTVQTWDADGTFRTTLTGHHRLPVISPDGAWLATVGEDGTVRTWDPDGTFRTAFSDRHGPARWAAISPDGAWLATIGASDSSKHYEAVRIWGSGGAFRANLTRFTGRAPRVAIASDGTWLATAQNHDVEAWNPDGTLRLKVGHNYFGPIADVAISSDGTWLAAVGAGGWVQTWGADGSARATLNGHSGVVQSVAIAPDGSWLVTAGSDGTVRTWDADGSPRAILTGHTGSVSWVAISPDGTWLATKGADGTIRLWDARGSSNVTPSDQASGTIAVTSAADGTWIATPASTVASRTSNMIAVAISPDGTWIATVSTESEHPSVEQPWGRARLWNADGTLRALIPHRGQVHGVAIAPDGTWLATTSSDETLRTWHADGTLKAARSNSRGTFAVAIAPGGDCLVTAGGLIQTWNADCTGRSTLTDSATVTIAIAISPDGTWLAAADWRSNTARTLSSDGTPRATLSGHTDEVTAVAISPDGTWIATTSKDGTARTWNADGTPRAVLPGHTGTVTAVAISRDSTWIATTGVDGTARIWDATASDGNNHDVALIRVDGPLAGCAWFPWGNELCLVGRRGIYRFTLHAP